MLVDVYGCFFGIDVRSFMTHIHISVYSIYVYIYTCNVMNGNVTQGSVV